PNRGTVRRPYHNSEAGFHDHPAPDQPRGLEGGSFTSGRSVMSRGGGSVAPVLRGLLSLTGIRITLGPESEPAAAVDPVEAGTAHAVGLAGTIADPGAAPGAAWSPVDVPR
ncbi:MAG: hypothetical protein ABR915_24280, partial [Thermoguttaceae bacterium]